MIFIASMTKMCLNVIIYGALFKLFQSEGANKIQMVAFLFGIGAMVGPLLVYLFQINTFKILAIFHLITIGSFLKYPLPELEKKN